MTEVARFGSIISQLAERRQRGRQKYSRKMKNSDQAAGRCAASRTDGVVK